MQLKNEPPIDPKPQQDNDVSKKKVSLLGVIVGGGCAAIVGGLVWHYFPHTKNVTSHVSKVETQNYTRTNEIHTKLKHEEKTEPSHVAVPPQPSPTTPAAIEPQKSLTMTVTPPSVKVTKLGDEERPSSIPENQAEPILKVKKNAVTNDKTNPNTHHYVNELSTGGYAYNALSPGPIVFAPAGSKIEISRDKYFKSIYSRGTATKFGEYRITNPPPGSIYWRIVGNSKINKIVIYEPQSIAMQIKIPKNLYLGDNITWSGNDNASYYTIDISDDPNFTNTLKTFSTTEKEMNTNIIGKGYWFMRISAMNMHKGTFDYSPIVPLLIEERMDVPSKNIPVADPRSKQVSQSPELKSIPKANSL